MFDKILKILSSLGLPGLLAGVYLEALGVPFPGSVLVALAGFLSKQGKINMILAWLVSLLGYILGSTTAFLIGRHVGEPFIKRWGRFLQLTPQRFDHARQWLQKSAPGFIIGGRFIPTVGNITPYVAGISGISLVRFLLYDMIHALLWVTTFLGAGALLGRNWHRLMDTPWLKWFWVAGGLILLIYIFRHRIPFYHRNKVS
ncbi:DedA family protein [Desulforamulus putei]|uniref:Membrane protein DedA, SNARE-associated domain n=1 Tax=Desulforamulus putei DSM 12395 TaxID=1121429 RepID=A0A1M4YQ47_9FIRM|nr:DedA family protein [Desulforamulus putei]SHF07788.1 membrane protein DedA, SNARE-associated domain [Desulforamulus putei DSM 12395]